MLPETLFIVDYIIDCLQDEYMGSDDEKPQKRTYYELSYLVNVQWFISFTSLYSRGTKSKISTTSSDVASTYVPSKNLLVALLTAMWLAII